MCILYKENKGSLSQSSIKSSEWITRREDLHSSALKQSLKFEIIISKLPVIKIQKPKPPPSNFTAATYIFTRFHTQSWSWSSKASLVHGQAASQNRLKLLKSRILKDQWQRNNFSSLTWKEICNHRNLKKTKATMRIRSVK